ncbi:MAG: YegP family protein [Anaerolineaceae bacterium]|nr:YegP family protein [Anaerolineaceae bacterium]
MAGKFEVKTTAGGQFMFNLKAGNGQIILTSESYKAKASALNGVESVKKNAKSKAQFETLESKNGQPYFVLKATNGEVIGRSEMYSSTSSMQNGIESVMENAPKAAVVEL